MADRRELLGRWDMADEHGDPVRMEDLPSVKVLAGERPKPMLLRLRAPRQRREVGIRAALIVPMIACGARLAR